MSNENINESISLKYVPKDGFDAGRTFYPQQDHYVTENGKFTHRSDDSFFYLTKDVLDTDYPSVYSVQSIRDVIDEVAKGSALLMVQPGADEMWVSAEQLKEQNPLLFTNELFLKEVAKFETYRKKREESIKRHGLPKDFRDDIERLYWDDFREMLNCIFSDEIELVCDAIGIRPTKDNKRPFIIALIINGNPMIRRAAEEMLSYGYVGGEEPRKTRCLERARVVKRQIDYIEGDHVQFLLDHFEEWKQYRQTLYKPLTAQQAYDKYGPEGIKEMWANLYKDEERFDTLSTYANVELDPSWAGDLIGGTDRVKEFFYNVLCQHAIKSIESRISGFDGEEFLRMK